MKHSTPSLLLFTLAWLLSATTFSCSSDSKPRAHQSMPTVIVIDRDAGGTTDAPNGSDAVRRLEDGPSDQTTTVTTDLVSPEVSVDGGNEPILRIDPSQVFPDCTGTEDEISNCIINLPTRAGTPINRPDPMDYALCTP